MSSFIGKRLVQGIVVLLLVTVFVFVLIHLIPGGEARAVLQQRATPASIAEFNRLNGLNLPIAVQYWHLVDGYAHFRFGYSFALNQSVRSLILERLPKTVLLVGLSVLLALVIAVPLGVIQVGLKWRWVDRLLTGTTFVLYGTPTFLLGTLLILLFALKLHWLDFEAPQAATVGGILADPRGLVLPVVTLAGVTIAAFGRFMRSSMMEAMTQDYIRTARAKGASRRRVFYRHALRNALLPLITLLGLSLPAIVSGAFIVEAVFNYPGMGLLGVDSIESSDIPTLIGIVVVATIATVVGSIVADVLYAGADPRIRYD